MKWSKDILGTDGDQGKLGSLSVGFETADIIYKLKEQWTFPGLGPLLLNYSKGETTAYQGKHTQSNF